MSTDYDCWHEEEEDVSVTAVIEVLKRNADLAGASRGRRRSPSRSSGPAGAAMRCETLSSQIPPPSTRRRGAGGG